MTSSTQEHTGNGEVDEHQKHAEKSNYYSSTEMPHVAAITHGNVQYGVPPPIGGPTMAPAAYPDPYYRGVFAPYDPQSYPAQPYPAQPMVHLQLMGMQQAGIPLPSDAVEEPVFVNAKQYHGILRRRQSRAKAESENKVVKVRKPYLHESRHLHAVRRARGCGGRFVNAKKKENQGKEVASNQGSENRVPPSDDRDKSDSDPHSSDRS